MEIDNNTDIFSNFTIIKLLGKGSYGKVKLVKHKKDNNYSALKILKKEAIIGLNQIEHVYSEYTILNQIKHQFIANLISIHQDSKRIYFQLEYVSGGELLTLLTKFQVFKLDYAKFIAAQVISVFEYLHSLEVIYRDLKPENIIIDSDGYIKIVDFGLAKKVNGKTYTLCGTPHYMAPELIMNRGHFKPLDWWTLGVLFYEMLIGIPPFDDPDPSVIYQKILVGKIKFPKVLDRQAKSFIKHLLVADTSKRLGGGISGVQSIQSHKLWNDFLWESLNNRTMLPFYIPKIKNYQDLSYCSDYSHSDSETNSISSESDIFIDW